MKRKRQNNFLIYVAILFISACNSTVKTLSDIESEVINILDFGAIPNDKIDDRDAIQKAIDYALYSGKISNVYIPPGIFNLSKGIVIGKQKPDGDIVFSTIKIFGHIPSYSSNQNIGNTSVLRLNSSSFTLAIQAARNSTIENIVFEGYKAFPNNIDDIQNWDLKQWSKLARTNQFSPSCAIAIDPFHTNIKEKNRYPGFQKYYSNNSISGTSMLTIRGCVFKDHYLAIANNPSANILNGDNISVEYSHVRQCHTFWSSGQTQSRNNKISNIYALFINTFISNTQIGSKSGTPPNVTNLNLAGYCKQFLDLSTGFSGFSIVNSYLENIWSLGIAKCNFVSLNNSQIKFYKGNDNSKLPPFHLYSNNGINFRDCSLEYFSNCTLPVPLIFYAPKISFDGGFIEGGKTIAFDIKKPLTQEPYYPHMENVVNKCLKYKNSISLEGQSQKSENMVTNTFMLAKSENRNENFIKARSNFKYNIGDILITNESYIENTFNQKNIRVRGILGAIVKNEAERVQIRRYSNTFLDKDIGIHVIKY